jgi:hypothetical protein
MTDVITKLNLLFSDIRAIHELFGHPDLKTPNPVKVNHGRYESFG